MTKIKDEIKEKIGKIDKNEELDELLTEIYRKKRRNGVGGGGKSGNIQKY